MAEDQEYTETISVTLSKRARDFLNERRRVLGVPVSRTVRDALEIAFPELRDEPQIAENGRAA